MRLSTKFTLCMGDFQRQSRFMCAKQNRHGFDKAVLCIDILCNVIERNPNSQILVRNMKDKTYVVLKQKCINLLCIKMYVLFVTVNNTKYFAHSFYPYKLFSCTSNLANNLSHVISSIKRKTDLLIRKQIYCVFYFEVQSDRFHSFFNKSKSRLNEI